MTDYMIRGGDKKRGVWSLRLRQGPIPRTPTQRKQNFLSRGAFRSNKKSHIYKLKMHNIVK